MTTKKKLGSKLANSVRQVKSHRDESSTARDDTTAAEKPASRSVATHRVKSAAPRAAKTDGKGFRPNRVWPD